MSISYFIEVSLKRVPQDMNSFDHLINLTRSPSLGKSGYSDPWEYQGQSVFQAVSYSGKRRLQVLIEHPSLEYFSRRANTFLVPLSTFKKEQYAGSASLSQEQ